MDIQNIEARADQRLIPWWIKIAITVFTCSVGLILVLAMISAQETLLGLSTQRIAVISSVLMLLSVSVCIVFWFFPNHPLTLSIYWLIRFLRDQLWLFAVIGVVTLFTMGVPFFSMRGGIPLIVFLLLFLMGVSLQPASLNDFPVSRAHRISALSEKWITKIGLIPPSILGLAVALLPILIICSIIYVGLDARLSDYGPYSFWNDETGYWLWLRSFGEAGFNAGYNTPQELIPPASFNHFGEGSPLYIYIYGSIARLAGWVPQLPLLINFVLLGLVIFVFIRATKLEPLQILFTGLIAIMTWPILLYLPMTTHETLNQVIGFLLAIVFFRFLTNREQASLPVRILSCALVFVAALVRLSWGLLLVPIIFYSLNGSVLRRVLLSILLGLGLFVSAVLVTNYLVSPVNNSILLNIKGSFLEGPHLLVEYVVKQFRVMFKFKELNPNIGVMLQIVIILIWGAIRVIRRIQVKQPITTILQSQSVFNIYSAGSLAIAGLLFYIQAGFYRTFTPSLLVIYLLQTIRKDYRPLIALMMVNLVFFHSYMTYYAQIGDAAIIRSDFTTEFAERAQLESEVANWITFDKTTQNPWCNTLFIPLHYYDYRLLAIPAGIGISYSDDLDEMRLPVKSKYLLFDPVIDEAFISRLNVQPLQPLSIGNLYYNLDSNCELNP